MVTHRKKKPKRRTRVINRLIGIPYGIDNDRTVELKQKLNAAENQLQQYKSQHQQSNAIAERLTNEKKRLESNIEQLKSTNEELKQQHDARIKLLEQQHASYKDGIKFRLVFLEKVARDRGQRLDSQKNEMDSLNQSIRDAEARHRAEVEKLTQQYNRQVKANQNILSEMKKNNDANNRELNKHINIIGQLEQQIQQLLQSKLKYEEIINEDIKIMDKDRRKIQHLIDNVKQIAAKNKNYEAIIHEDNQTIVQEQRKIEKLEKTDANLRQQLEAKQQEVNDRIAELRQKNAQGLMVKAVEENKIKKLQWQIISLKSESAICKDNLTKAYQERDSVNKDYENYKQIAASEMKNVKEMLGEASQRVNEKAQQLQVCNEKLEEALSKGVSEDQLQKLQKEADEKYQKLEQEKENAIQKVTASYMQGASKRQKEIDALKLKASENIKQIEEKEKQILDLQQKLEKVQSEFDEREKSFNFKEASLQEINELQQQLKILTIERDQCLKKHKKIESDYDFVVEQVNSLTKELNDWARKFKDMETQNRNNIIKVKQCNDDFNEYKNQLQTNPAQFCGEYTKGQMKPLQDRISELENLNSQLNIENNQAISEEDYRKGQEIAARIVKQKYNQQYQEQMKNLIIISSIEKKSKVDGDIQRPYDEIISKKGIPLTYVTISAVKITTEDNKEYKIYKYRYDSSSRKVQGSLVDSHNVGKPVQKYFYVLSSPMSTTQSVVYDNSEVLDFINTIEDIKSVKYMGDNDLQFNRAEFGRRTRKRKVNIASLLRIVNKYI